MLDFVGIGYRLRQARKSWKITQEQAAEIIDVSVETIRNIEHGYTKTSTATICALLDLYELPTDILRKYYVRETGMNERIKTLKIKRIYDSQKIKISR